MTLKLSRQNLKAPAQQLNLSNKVFANIVGLLHFCGDPILLCFFTHATDGCLTNGRFYDKIFLR